ncbi:MAG: YbjQ family protein [Ignavibacteriaceae bacterium]|jgi:uncharacterized protein YbjQ (UPF0145 family)|nr:YbjQ family protein [Ignavibacteriaceae bacterium]
MANKPCESCGKLVSQRYASNYIPDKWICSECRENEKPPADVQGLEKELIDIIITTTYAIEGRKVVKYLDVISAEVIQGINIFSDFGASVADVFGGSAKGYQKALDQMKKDAFKIIRKKAYNLGANAVVGVDLDYGDLRGTMLMLVVNGTAVKVE